MSKHDLPLGHIDSCQICASTELELVIDLGYHPPCDSLLNEKQLMEKENTYPLRFIRCKNCGLAQIDHVVAPEELFYPDYPYRTGITETLARNLQSTATKIVKNYKLAPETLAIDIGSNDGTLLQGFKAQGMKTLGVEPTKIAEIAIQNGIPTVQEFFTEAIAKRIKNEYGQASVITAANMFAHIPNLGDLLSGVRELLENDGVFVTESHYLLDLLQTVQYDSIYHEHLKYYALKPLLILMQDSGFTVIDAERIPNYGGSIRVYTRKGEGHHISERLHQLIQEEEATGIYDQQIYSDFRDNVVRSKIDLQTLLLDLRRQEKRVVGVGCPGRSSTLLNFCNIDVELMPYIAEQSTSLKLGLFLPGKHIPIVDESIMFEENPDYVVMLSWHYAAPIMKKLREKGLKSKFIMPLPEVRIVED